MKKNSINTRLPNRQEMGQLIVERINELKDSIKAQYNQSKHHIGHFYIDNILPQEIAGQISANFPTAEQMVHKKSIRENKHIGVQMNEYHPILEEALYAFQNQDVIERFKDICGVKDIYADEYLYAGGLSMMGEGQFLNPHLDNSHDKDRERWRVFNLLYYVTPNWEDANGGHLEIWPKGIGKERITIHSRHNRLVVMATHQHSWHSVSKVVVNGYRKCISNYYFSNYPLVDSDTFHVTTFRGWPEQKLRNQALKVDSFLRMQLRKLFKKKIVKDSHVYRKEG